MERVLDSESSTQAAAGTGQGTGPGTGVGPATVKRWRELLESERDAAALYARLAEAETGERQEIFRELAATELRHAAHWTAKLRSAGAEVPPAGKPSLRTRLLGAAAGRLSVQTVLPLIERAEHADAGMYDDEPDALPEMAADERAHARALAALVDREPGSGPGTAEPDPVRQIARRERWHRSDRSGALRAGVFGVSDGLVSNTALVMGFAGSGVSHAATLLAGVAGLLAGSFSMAAGEYISMSSQREMFQREISLEQAELEEKPDEERDELVLIYRAKGLAQPDAERLADKIMADRTVALDTLAREELGLDPGQLGSPWTAAGSSLLAFAAGAFVVVLPYLIGSGTAALVAAVVLALAAMFGVGAVIGALNGRSAVRMGLRQLAVGALAAAVTFGVGHLIGASVA
ncbi:MAG TPA: VIT1/CCC1 transporter family protein [Trebonia sp.]|nr:VIT1/CCC1 transporter family protein [Trebonia sp.]